jgi:hypothetical protein
MTYLNINTKINSIRVNSNRSKGYGKVTAGLTDLPPGVEAPGTHCTGPVDSEADMDAVKKRKLLPY